MSDKSHAFLWLEQDHAKIQAALRDSMRLTNELAAKLATAGCLCGFSCDDSKETIAAKVRARLNDHSTSSVATPPHQTPRDQPVLDAGRPAVPYGDV